MDIGVAGLVGYLADAESGLNGGGAVKVPEGVRRDDIGVVVADSVDLLAAQRPSPPADKQIGPAIIRAFRQILLYRVHHFVSNEHAWKRTQSSVWLICRLR